MKPEIEGELSYTLHINIIRAISRIFVDAGEQSANC